MAAMSDELDSLAFALDKYRDRLQIAQVDQLVTDSARRNEKRPAWLKIAVPDDMVKNVRGSQNARDLVLLVQIPREVLERAESRIVLPGEVRS